MRLVFKDKSAMWPSRYHNGPVRLHEDGRFSTPTLIGRCQNKESVAIDPDYPLYAYWQGDGWSYSDKPSTTQSY